MLISHGRRYFLRNGQYATSVLYISAFHLHSTFVFPHVYRSCIFHLVSGGTAVRLHISPCPHDYAEQHTWVVHIPASYHAVWYHTVTYQIYCQVNKMKPKLSNTSMRTCLELRHQILGSTWTRTTIKIKWKIPFAFYSLLLLQKEMWLEMFQPECNTQQHVHWCNNLMKFILSHSNENQDKWLTITGCKMLTTLYRKFHWPKKTSY